MEEVDLKNFQIVKNERGVLFVNKNNVMLQNSATGEVLTTAYSNVSSFYGLDNHSSDANIITEDNYHESSPEISMKEDPADDDSSSEEVPVEEEKPRPALKWEREETKYMLNLYAKYIDSIGPERRFRTKKLMWAHIATLLSNKFKMSPNGTQVESRYKCVAKRNKKLNKAAEQVAPPQRNYAFANFEQDDPIDIDRVMAPKQIIMIPRRTVTVPPPDPATLIKMIPTSTEPDEEVLVEGDASGSKRYRKTPQIVMFEKYLGQKAKFYEQREAKYDERARQKAERERLRDRIKQKREEEKKERENKKEIMKQQRHLDKIMLLRQILNKDKTNTI